MLISNITFFVYIYIKKNTKNVFLICWASFKNCATTKKQFGFKAYP